MTETPTLAAHAAEAAEPVTLENVLYALNSLNRPRPSEDDSPWESGHYIRVDHLPAFINTIAAAWFKPQETAAALEAQAAQIEALRADAERYRWLRDNDQGDWHICQWSEQDECYVADCRVSRFVDAAIDAAMAAKEPR